MKPKKVTNQRAEKFQNDRLKRPCVISILNEHRINIVIKNKRLSDQIFFLNPTRCQEQVTSLKYKDVETLKVKEREKKAIVAAISQKKVDVIADKIHFEAKYNC